MGRASASTVGKGASARSANNRRATGAQRETSDEQGAGAINMLSTQLKKTTETCLDNQKAKASTVKRWQTIKRRLNFDQVKQLLRDEFSDHIPQAWPWDQH